MHTYVLSVWGTEVISVSVIIAMASMTMPSMGASIGGVEGRTSEKEVVTVWVTKIYTEVPVSCFPIQWTVEI